MYTSLLIWSTLSLSFAMLVLMSRRLGIKDPLVTIFSFYFFFSYGPVLNYLLGYDIYFGIVPSRIFEATILFTIVMVTVFVVSALVKPKKPFDNVEQNRSKSLAFVVSFVLVIFVGYSLYILLLVAPNLSGLRKSQKLILGPPFHYQYLFLQMCIISLYFHIQQLRKIYILYVLNFVLYVAYCIAFTERDFIFVILSIVLHKYLLKNIKFSLKQYFTYISVVSLLVFLALAIVGIRSGFVSSNSFLVNAFNEGSILFIVTNILEWTDRYGIEFVCGHTYLQSLLNLLPGVIVDQRDELFFLSRWFVDMYAPGSLSAYGFSLGAEAYLNFGYWGIPFVFGGFVLIQRWGFNRIGSHPFYLFFSVFFVSFSMYSLRNDSLALVSGIFHAIIFFFCIYFISKILMPRY